MSVSVAPNCMLIFDEAFTAQPLAFRRGAMFLRLSFIHAITIDGPDMRRRIPMITSIACHQLSATKPFARLTKNEPIIPRAIPIAANIPANLAMSNGGAADGTGADASAGVAGILGASVIFLLASAIILASLSAADLFMKFSTVFAILRYGDQKACAMLIGLSMILVTTASQSSPELS